MSHEQSGMNKIGITKPVVVSEFPKSGGSWIVSMLGKALGVACRDIYMQPGFDLFDFSQHPWYVGVEVPDFPTQSVIKSHELPGSLAIPFDVTQVHLVRDGRDVVVSKYFFERDFCVKNGIIESFDQSFESFVASESRSWANYVSSWLEQPGVLTIRYESFLADPAGELGALVKALTGATLDEDVLLGVVGQFTRERFSASLASTFKHNTFVRKGVRGDWVNHFNEMDELAFEAGAGHALRRLGYETDTSWLRTADEPVSLPASQVHDVVVA